MGNIITLRTLIRCNFGVHDATSIIVLWVVCCRNKRNGARIPTCNKHLRLRARRLVGVARQFVQPHFSR